MVASFFHHKTLVAILAFWVLESGLGLEETSFDNKPTFVEVTGKSMHFFPQLWSLVHFFLHNTMSVIFCSAASYKLNII